MWQQQWIIGNWKMNGRQRGNRLLMSALTALSPTPSVVCGVAAPTPYLAAVRAQTEGSAWLVGAQDVSRFADDGAYTGETSAAMLADIGARFVLVGHSERRQYFGEAEAVLADKYRAALAAGLLPLLCVGETLAQRQGGEAEAVVAAQLALLADMTTDAVAVAYEPVWAIGTGQVASTTQICDMHGFIHRQILSLCGEAVKIRVLYGGSVNAQNAAALLAVPGVDGALVGGASLQAESFAAIIAAANA